MNVNEVKDPNAAQDEQIEGQITKELSKYPPVTEYYEAFFVNVYGSKEDSLDILASSNCPIGGRLSIKFGDNPEDVVILTREQTKIASLSPEDAVKVSEIKARRWIITVVPTLVMYSATEEAYSAEFAIMCCNSADVVISDALKGFIRNIIRRIKRGDHPHVTLSQSQFELVIEQNGQWYMTREAPMPKKQRGALIIKRRQSMVEGLGNLSYEHKVGCTVISWAILIVIAAVIVTLIIVL